MFQFLSKLEGLDVKDHKNKTFRISPQRDLNYTFPVFIFKAFAFLENRDNSVVSWYFSEGGSDEELKRLAKSWADFIQITADAPDIDINTAAKKANLHQFDKRAHAVLGYALGNVIASAYFAGLREANSSDFKPFIFMSPKDIYEACTPKGKRPPRNKIWRLIRSLFRI